MVNIIVNQPHLGALSWLVGGGGIETGWEGGGGGFILHTGCIGLNGCNWLLQGSK